MVNQTPQNEQVINYTLPFGTPISTTWRRTVMKSAKQRVNEPKLEKKTSETGQ